MTANVARALNGKYAEFYAATSGSSPTNLVRVAMSWNMTVGFPSQNYNSIDGEGWQSTTAGPGSGTGQLMLTISPDEMFGESYPSGTLIALKCKIDAPAGAFYISGDARLGQFAFSGWDRSGGVQTISVPFDTDGPWAGLELLGDLTAGSGFSYS
jgi:hypothetical protein